MTRGRRRSRNPCRPDANFVKPPVDKLHRTQMLDDRHEESGGSPLPFGGFLPLTANYLYCPNQFFDVCLPHASRGVVRLVAYLLRRTLGWLDKDGKPVEQQIVVSYQDFIQSANVSRGSIAKVIDEAIDGGFVRRVQRGRANGTGRAGQAGRFELRWAEDGPYVTDPKRFRGFFTGEGHRSPVPDSFFDRVIPAESLAVAQVVGAVLRHTVGYQNQFGGRRPHASLSYSYLQRYTGIGGRRHLRDAVQQSLERNYVQVIQEGFFNPMAGHKGQAAQYGVRWVDSGSVAPGIGLKREPTRLRAVWARSVQKGHQRNGSKGEPAGWFKKGTSDRPRREPAERFKKGTEEKTSTKDTSQKQQQSAGADSPVSLLLKEGFDERTASALAADASAEAIRNQIVWLPRRQPSRNRLGMLRRAIVEEWPEPKGELRTSVGVKTPAGRFAQCFYAGLANNPGEPVAIPSDRDLADAEQFVSRLAPFSTGLSQFEAWGRSLGAMARQTWQQNGGRGAVCSLRTALRTRGDQLIVQVLGKLKKEAENKMTTEVGVHSGDVQARYLQYLEHTESAIRTGRPADYARFEGWRERERERYAANKVGARLLLRWFDSPPKRLEDLQSFFGQELLSFEAWAASSLRSENPTCESLPSSTLKAAAARAPSP
jgi:hypothetical protein